MQQYALIGRKLGHSYSADFFNQKFRSEGIDAHYSLIELASFDEFRPLLSANPDIVGVNVTIPYKIDAMAASDLLTPVAREIGAVNVIRIVRKPDGTVILYATNTDAIGFARALSPYIEGRSKALVLGTGGASRAVCYALRQMGIEVAVVSRHPKPGNLAYNQLTPEVIANNLLIVNTTPLGMSPNTDTAPDIPYELLTERHFCFDLVYNPDETEFMKRAARNGAGFCNGLQMLKNQAIAAWEFWQNEI